MNEDKKQLTEQRRDQEEKLQERSKQRFSVMSQRNTRQAEKEKAEKGFYCMGRFEGKIIPEILLNSLNGAEEIPRKSSLI